MQTIDWWSLYVCAAYCVLAPACAVGAFSEAFAANLAQRIALAGMAVWAVWRIELVFSNGWGYPHEPFIATAMVLYALGSVQKTVKHIHLARKGQRRANDIL